MGRHRGRLGWPALLAGLLTLLLALAWSNGLVLTVGLVVSAVAAAHLADQS